jgi:hypothetical protein
MYNAVGKKYVKSGYKVFVLWFYTVLGLPTIIDIFPNRSNLLPAPHFLICLLLVFFTQVSLEKRRNEKKVFYYETLTSCEVQPKIGTTKNMSTDKNIC